MILGEQINGAFSYHPVYYLVAFGAVEVSRVQLVESQRSVGPP